ncbi:MAG TPA: sulfotransferase [Myxococcota bacterium]|nr:sulfotransferase [Myxococcota bacterium]
MIKKPVLIVGAPRSGTSLLQKIIRDHPSFWSLPSESDLIWDRHCHPRLWNWKSEHLDASDLTEQARRDILRRFDRFSMPAGVWRAVERLDLIWTFKRKGRLRPLLRRVYDALFPYLNPARLLVRDKRLVEKTASNCFRLGFVNGVFPDARIIHPVRDGRNNVNSLINGWLHPTRFFTYDLPVPLNIPGYPHQRWNFVLPPGWRDYLDRPIEEICAFQWVTCNESVLAETSMPAYDGRVLRIQIEALSADPLAGLRRLADFIEVPFDDYFRRLADDLPVVNSPDGQTDANKWRRQNANLVERIAGRIEPTMRRLGYTDLRSSQI